MLLRSFVLNQLHHNGDEVNDSTFKFFFKVSLNLIYFAQKNCKYVLL